MLLCVTTFFEDQKLIEYPQHVHYERDLIDGPSRASEKYDGEQTNGNYITQSEQGTRHDEDSEMNGTLLRPGKILQGTNFRLKSNLINDWERFATLGVEACPCFPALELTSSDVTRWKMASRHEKRHPMVPNRFRSRCGNWPEVAAIFDLPVALGFSGAALIYGGLHALAWSAHFDSFTEQLLWRMSACMLMGGFPVCYIIIGICRRALRWLENRHLSQLGVLRQKVFTYIEGFVAGFVYLILLAYILARAFLVIESFINLSHLPAGAYDVPRWSAYFPSIS